MCAPKAPTCWPPNAACTYLVIGDSMQLNTNTKTSSHLSGTWPSVRTQGATRESMTLKQPMTRLLSTVATVSFRLLRTNLEG